MSLLAPGEVGTTIRIAWLGYFSCASAPGRRTIGAISEHTKSSAIFAARSAIFPSLNHHRALKTNIQRPNTGKRIRHAHVEFVNSTCSRSITALRAERNFSFVLELLVLTITG